MRKIILIIFILAGCASEEQVTTNDCSQPAFACETGFQCVMDTTQNFVCVPAQGTNPMDTNSGMGTTGTDMPNGTDTNGMGTNGTGTDTNSMNTSGTNTNGTDTNGTDTNGTDTNGTDTNGTDTNGTDTSGMGTSGTDTNGTDTNGTDPNDTDPNDTDPNDTDPNDTDPNNMNMDMVGDVGIDPDAPCNSATNGCPIIEWIKLDGASFGMGSNTGGADEQPVRQVTVSNFEIMRTEVTVGMYRACVNAGVCTEPSTLLPACTWSEAPASKESYPINCMTWFQLNDFATWVGARLPSEAEWEFAARGGARDVLYPWGDDAPSCNRVSYSQCQTETSPVCSHPDGNTPQGVCDMAGNVWEWVLDEYQNDYSSAPIDGSAFCTNPNCEDAGQGAFRVFRGGYWFGQENFIRVSYRGSGDPAVDSGYRGGRLARTID